MNPNHPNCTCPQCAEMQQQASLFALRRAELRRPVAEAAAILESAANEYLAAVKAGNIPQPLMDKLIHAKNLSDAAWKEYQAAVAREYEKYPIAHHA